MSTAKCLRCVADPFSVRTARARPATSKPFAKAGARLSRVLWTTAFLPAIILLAGGPAREAWSADFEIKGGATFRGYLERNNLDAFFSFLPPPLAEGLFGYSEEDRDSQYLLLWAYARGALTVADRASFVLSADSGVWTWQPGDDTYSHGIALEGMDPKEGAKKIVFVREAYAEWGIGEDYELLLSVGKRRTVLLDGLYYDDYGFAASVDWRIWEGQGSSLRTIATALVPYHYWDEFDADLLVSDVKFALSEFPIDTVTVGFMWTRDRAGLGASMIQDILLSDSMSVANWEMAANLSGVVFGGNLNTYTFYGSATLDLGIAELTAVYAMQWGRGRIGPLKAETWKDTRLEGHLLYLDVGIEILPSLEVMPFFLLASGVTPETAPDFRFTHFSSLVPYFPHVSIFFSGGLNASLTNRQFGLLGVGSAGVSAAGLLAAFSHGDWITVTQAATVLSSNRPKESLVSGNYGLELDTSISFAFWDGVTARLEFDVLFPGDYFTADDPVFRTIAGLDAEF